mgnify:CR=1 FL=1
MFIVASTVAAVPQYRHHDTAEVELMGKESPSVSSHEALKKFEKEVERYELEKTTEKKSNLEMAFKRAQEIKAAEDREKEKALRIAEARKRKAEEIRKAHEAQQRKQAQLNSSRDTRGDVRRDTQSRPIKEAAPQQQSGQTIRMHVTAYTAGYESTQKKAGEAGYGITASGTTVTEGRTLACGPEFSFGTKMSIPSLGISGVCEDRGGAIDFHEIDVFISDLSRARAFGEKTLDVIVEGR